MGILSSIRGDKLEFCLLVIKYVIFAVAQALTSLIHDFIECSISDILSRGADICNCK